MKKIVIFIQFLFISGLYIFIIFPICLVIFNPNNEEQISTVTISAIIASIVCGAITTYITEKESKNNQSEQKV